MHELVSEELADLLAMPNHGVRLREAFANRQIHREGEWVAQPIETMAQLLAMEPCEFLRIPNLGRRSLNVLEQALAERGLHLGRSPSSQRWRDVMEEPT